MSSSGIGPNPKPLSSVLLQNLTQTTIKVDLSYLVTTDYPSSYNSTNDDVNSQNMTSNKVHNEDELIHWAIACASLTVVTFIIATIMYIRKRYNDPEIRRKRKIQEQLKKVEKQNQDKESIHQMNETPIIMEKFVKDYQHRKSELLHKEFMVLTREALHNYSLDAAIKCGKKICRQKKSDQAHSQSVKDTETKKGKGDSSPKANGLLKVMQQTTVNGAPIMKSGANASYAIAKALLSIDKDDEVRRWVYKKPMYVDGQHRKNSYIAALAPTAKDTDDFWMMIWRTSCNCILMLTDNLGYGKVICHQYWPDTHSCYGDIDVTFQSIHTTADYEIRAFCVKKKNSPDTRTIHHIKMNCWTKTSPPEPVLLLTICQKVYTWIETTENPGPVVVHDVNNFDRTGTFIAIDEGYRRFHTVGSVNIFHFVMYLKNKHPSMVNEEGMYLYIWDCLSAYVQCHTTVIGTHQLEGLVKQLGFKTWTFGRTGFDREYQILQDLTTSLTVGECAGGFREENRKKNREYTFLPPDRARPYLKTISTKSSDETDYINAVYLNGYRDLNTFLATQWPLKNTINDFWRMLYDCDIQTVVVLNHEKQNSWFYPPFWPSTITAPSEYGSFDVTLLQGKRMPHVMMRTFKIQKRKKYLHIYRSLGQIGEKLAQLEMSYDNDARVIKMFQLLDWPKPTRNGQTRYTALLEFIRDVEKWQTSLKSSFRKIPLSSNTICIVSRDGLSRCGPYCVLTNALAKVQAEEEVDIFTTAKLVRVNQPQLIKNASEYRMCYEAVLEYVQNEKLKRNSQMGSEMSIGSTATKTESTRL